MVTGTGNEKLLYRVPEAAELLGISRSRLYELLGRGDISSVKIGRARLIRREELENFVESLGQDNDSRAIGQLGGRGSR